MENIVDTVTYHEWYVFLNTLFFFNYYFLYEIIFIMCDVNCMVIHYRNYHCFFIDNPIEYGRQPLEKGTCSFVFFP
jgi:hypothetical protein